MSKTDLDRLELTERTQTPFESAIKFALDRAELVEHVAELQRRIAAVNVNERGDPVLVLPRHPLVTAFIKELADANIGRERDVDLKTARRNFNAANRSYDKRVCHRIGPAGQMIDDERHMKYSRFVSLSAILIDRAEAMFWRKVVKELEYTARIKEQNRRAIVRHRLRSIGLAS
jgi:hypothetical protein